MSRQSGRMQLWHSSLLGVLIERDSSPQSCWIHPRQEGGGGGLTHARFHLAPVCNVNVDNINILPRIRIQAVHLQEGAAVRGWVKQLGPWSQRGATSQAHHQGKAKSSTFPRE